MNWTNYFDEIFLINLPDLPGRPGRPDRLKKASDQLKWYNIPFTVWPAIKDEDGRKGLLLTMQALFKANQDKKRILVFEDDIKFVEDPNIYMPLCMEQLILKGFKDYWDLFYLGINMDNEHNLFSHFKSNNVLPVKFGYSTHAVAYSKDAIKAIFVCLNSHLALSPNDIAYDVLLTQIIQKAGNCYCSYPLLATQDAGYSDIEKKGATYEYIQQRFDHSVKHLLETKNH